MRYTNHKQIIRMNDSHKNSDSQTIFIQIASYRDEELPKTIESCLKNAAFPERLRFGIYNQYDEDTEHYLDIYKDDNRFNITGIPWEESRGVGVARNACNQLYNDEDFTMQIDSHMRFVQEWDTKLINEWLECDDEKAVLSSYPPEYRYDGDREIFIDIEPSMLVVRSFDNGFIPVFKSHPVGPKISRPLRANFVCGGFMFSVGKVCRDIPYCKDICFTGEEIVHSVRLFTFGYRVYCLSKWHLYHLYDRPNGKRFWHDFNDTESHKEIYTKMATESDQMVRSILLEGNTDLLGSANSLEDFENYAGINFKEKILHPSQIEGLEPPYASNSAWLDETSPFKRVPIDITITTSDFDMSLDYDFWYFGLHDENENELMRDDINETNLHGDSITIAKEYLLRTTPTKYIIWPHSKTKGWLERKVYSL